MTLEEKKGYYKKRLYDGFIIGDQCNSKGTNLVAIIRQYERYNSGILKWEDTIIHQSYYISYLATELFIAIRKNDISGKESSRDALIRALNALDRLDKTANLYYGGKESIDGFLIRDDVDNDILDKFPNIKHSKEDGPVDNIKSDLRPGWNNPHLKEMSQDQIWHLLHSLFVTQHLLRDNDKELSDRAIETADRIIGYMKECDWNIKNPVTKKPVYRGAKVLWFKYGFAASVNRMLKNTGSRYKEENVTNKLIYLTVREAQRLCTRLGVFKTWSEKDIPFMLFDSMLDNRGYDKLKRLTIKKQRYEHLYLIKHILNGTTPSKKTQRYYLDLLNECPSEGIFNETIKIGSTIKDRFISGNTWCFHNRLTREQFKDPHNKQRATGRFNGIDFLLLYNLYEIVFS